MSGKPVPVRVRFFMKVRVGAAPRDCWEWTGTRTHGGYGQFWPTRRAGTTAHRFAYEMLVGPVQKGMHVDHLCRNRGCVNPMHLEPVTPRENMLRGKTNATKTACPKGHPYDAHERKRNVRYCAKCKNAAAARRSREKARLASALS